MSLFGQLWTWLKSLASGQKGTLRGHDPRPYLAGEAPGWWATNHLNESQRACEGWQFVVIRAVARMCSQATLKVQEIGTRRERFSRMRQALRWAELSGQKSRARYWQARIQQLKNSPAEVGSDGLPGSGGQMPGRDVDPDDPLLRLLQRWNPQWSLATGLFAFAQQHAATGSCLLWRVRDELGYPAELYVLPTGLVTPRPPSAEYPRGSYYLHPLSSYGLESTWSEGTLGSALLTGAEIDGRDVKPIRWPHLLYLSDGLSAVSAGRLWVDIANEMDRSCFYGLQNSEKPGMIFERSGDLPQPDKADLTRFEEYLRAERTGSTNTGKHLLLPAGVKAQDRSRTPAEMDYGEGRPAYRDANMALHGMTPIACGISEAGNYSAFWASLGQSIEQAIQPVLNLLAGELTELLGEEFDGPRRQIGLDARRIDDPQIKLQEDAARTRRASVMLQASNAVLVREFRETVGLPPLGDARDLEFVRGGSAPEEPEEGDEQDLDLDGDGEQDEDGEEQEQETEIPDLSGEEETGVERPEPATPGR